MNFQLPLQFTGSFVLSFYFHLLFSIVIVMILSFIYQTPTLECGFFKNICYGNFEVLCSVTILTLSFYTDIFIKAYF